MTRFINSPDAQYGLPLIVCTHARARRRIEDAQDSGTAQTTLPRCVFLVVGELHSDLGEQPSYTL